MCVLRLGENGLGKYGLAKNWEQFKIVHLFMDQPVQSQLSFKLHPWMGQDVGETRRDGTEPELVVAAPAFTT